LEQLRDRLTTLPQIVGQAAIRHECDKRGVLPHAVAHPVSLDRECGDQAPINSSAKRDGTVWNSENVAPEGVGWTEALHRGKVTL